MIILSFYANAKPTIASVAAVFHSNHPHRTIHKSIILPKSMVERLELSANFFTCSALSGSSLSQELEGCFKKPKKTAIRCQFFTNSGKSPALFEDFYCDFNALSINP
jgi:hypothetical protein